MAIDGDAVTPARLGVPKPLAFATSVADCLDEAVPCAGDAVAVDSSIMMRWAGTLFAFCSLLLVPWTVVLAVMLPSRQVSSHYDVAWAGFDFLLFTSIASTAFLTLRRSRYLTVSSAAAGGLLVTDAWFDVLTAPGLGAFLEAATMSVIVELPLAAVCFWLAMHTQDVLDQRIRFLLVRVRP